MGRTIGAEEALRAGLVNRVVPVAELPSVVREYATILANAADRTWAKMAINDVYSYGMGVDAGLRHLTLPTWPSGKDDSVHEEWRRRIQDEGVKSAVAWRDSQFRLQQ